MEQLPYQVRDEVGNATVPRIPRLLLTVEEAANCLGVCRSIMFKLIRQGDVKSVKVGHLRRVTPAALEEFIHNLSTSADSAA